MVNKYKRSDLAFIGLVLSFALMSFFIMFMIWTCVDRSDFAGPFAITMYSFMSVFAIATGVFTALIHLEAVKNENEIGIKYAIWAGILSLIMVGQYMFVHIYKRSGIRKRVVREALITYWSTRVNKLIDEQIHFKLEDEDKAEVITLLRFKDRNILKKYEANYYVASILVRRGVLKDMEVDKEELSTIASNVI